MKVSLRWLADYIDLPTDDADEIAHALDMLGHGVEGIQRLDAEWTDVVIGRVDRIEPHPDADKVRVTYVDLGGDELQQIICGAWNFTDGAVVPVAVPGAVLPGGFEIGSRKIRGVTSNGMICSERELGLGDAHEGIMVLEPDAPIGDPFAAILELPDVVIDLDITNNRPDVMGMVGVARELAAWFDVPVRLPETDLATVEGSPATTISISAADGCNRFVAREVRGVTIGASPLWMRERLRRAGVRAISNVVDVSNYVMVELGHPLHAFDADRIGGDRLDVRWATDGEVLTTLDGVERTLGPQDLVIADDDGPTSLAAVMGGARSEVQHGTSRVLMEAASWHPATVMYTSRRHDLRSEASARFERGVDPNLAPHANDRACRVLVEVAGGEVLDGRIDVVANTSDPWTLDVDAGEVRRVLGERFTATWCADALRKLDFGVTVDGEILTVTVPTRRRDVTRPADLIEEIARLADFDTFEATLPTGPAGGLSTEQRREKRLREALRGLGLHQAINLPFVSPEELATFTPDAVDHVVTVRNPLREDQSKLRQSLLPGLLRNVGDNLRRGARSVALFEMGRVFRAVPWAEDGRVPDQPMRLALAVVGEFGVRDLAAPAPVADAHTALALIDAIAATMGVALERTAAERSGLHPTRTASVRLEETAIGYAGEIHPDVAARYEIGARVAVAELDLAPLVAPVPYREFVELSTFPHVDYDLSFEVPDGVTAAALAAATSGAVTSTFHVENVEVFDEYRPADGGLRSLAVRYRLRAPDRTLTSEDVGEGRRKMIEAAAEIGAVLRGASEEEAG
jgi:phenylalanyl-tRNA synthetase beta chain